MWQAKSSHPFSRCLPVFLFIAALAALMPVAGGHAQAAVQHRLSLEAPELARSLPVRESDPVRAERLRTIVLNPALTRSDSVAVGDELILDLFEDVRFDALIDRVTKDKMGSLTIRARLVGKPFSQALIITTGERTSVYIDVPERDRFYQITCDRGSGDYRLYDIRRENLEYRLPLAKPIPQPPASDEESDRQPPETPQAGISDRSPAKNERDGNTRIDVMVVYTPAARQWAAGRGGIDNVIAAAMANVQLTADNSAVNVDFRLVHSAQVDYSESRSDTDLERLTYPSDGYMDEVHAWRDDHGVDMVAILTDATDVGGIAWLVTDRSGSPGYAFSLTSVRQAATSYTLVHEMGHNMGLHHHKAQNFQPGPGMFNHSAGWRWVGSDRQSYCSVMSYAGGSFYPDGVDSRSVPYYSNPQIRHMGAAAGHALDGDNARNVREIKQVVAAYRTASDDGSDPTPPAIVIPSGYDAEKPDTWPLLVPRGTVVFEAQDRSRSYDWTVGDSNGSTVTEQRSGASTFAVAADVLFDAAGAGAYTITLTDRNHPGLEGATLQVRVPMRFVAKKYEYGETPDRGTYLDDEDPETFTVLGGPEGTVYHFEAFDLQDRPLSVDTCGRLAQLGFSPNMNAFIFTKGIPREVSFKVRVRLNPAANTADVQQLVGLGLDELWSGIFTVMPADLPGCGGFRPPVRK